MAVLQKLRGWGIVLSILVALPLLLFIIDPSQLDTALNSMSSKYDVGQINGKSISYTDFQAETDYYSRLSELMTGSSASSEQQQTEIRNAAWQGLIDKYLFLKKAREAGIRVGNAELVDLTSGETLSPIIAQNAVFAGEDGYFSKDQLRAFLENLESDPSGQLKMYWDYIQKQVNTNQYYGKYNALFTASNVENALMLENTIAENNTTADVEFVMLPFSFATDTTIVVSDKEIRDYYKSHKEFFRQKAGRDIEYVVYQVVPSAKDIAAEGERFTALYDEFTTTDNLRGFLQRNSDTQYNEYYYKAGELASVNADVEAFVAANTTGTSPVITDGNSYYAARILDSAQRPDSVFVRHILLQGTDANHLADSLLGVVSRKGADFAAIATLYSADQASAADGENGAIGWMTQTMMIPGFESVLTAKLNAPYLINTQYGTHVVEVTRATKPVLKKQVALFQKETLASQETFNEYYNLANRFATLAAGSTANYRAAVDSMSRVKDAVAATYSHPMSITEATDTYGSIGHAKELTRWAFDNKPGKVSNIITVDNNNFFVATVKSARKDGYAPVQEVARTIKDELYATKYAAKRNAEVAAQIAGMTDLEQIAEKLDASVNTQSGLAFSSMGARGLDPAFIGAVAAAPLDKVCGPVSGAIGTYIFRVTGRDTGAFYTEDDARNYRNQLASYASQMILPVMMDDAGVKDNRARFF